MLLDFGAPGKVRLPVGQEHGRTIPLAEVQSIWIEAVVSSRNCHRGSEARQGTLGDLLGMSRLRTRPALGARLGMAKRRGSTGIARPGTSALLTGLRAKISRELIDLAKPVPLK